MIEHYVVITAIPIVLVAIIGTITKVFIMMTGAGEDAFVESKTLHVAAKELPAARTEPLPLVLNEQVHRIHDLSKSLMAADAPLPDLTLSDIEKFGMGQLDEAITLYQETIKRAGSDADRTLAQDHLAAQLDLIEAELRSRQSRIADYALNGQRIHTRYLHTKYTRSDLDLEPR